MIQGTYYKEWSSVLNREMEFKVYGSAGEIGRAHV